LFAPRSAPRVLDFPVVLAISAIANGEDTMIKRSATSTAEDTRFVELKARLIGFNSNTDWGNIDGRTKSVLGVGNIFVARELRVSGG